MMLYLTAGRVTVSVCVCVCVCARACACVRARLFRRGPGGQVEFAAVFIYSSARSSGATATQGIHRG